MSDPNLKRVVVVGIAGDARRDPDDPHKWLPATGSGGNSFYTYSLNVDGGLTYLDGPIVAGVMPMWVTQVAIDGKMFLYSVDNTKDEFGIRAYALDGKTGAMTALNMVETGAGPCHSAAISDDKGKRYLVVAHYEGGGVAVHPINQDGTIGVATSTTNHESGALKHSRQDAPHPHGVTFNNGWIYVPDLGKNTIYQYSVDFEKGTLGQVNETTVHESAGPRHISFGSSNRAYAINELDNTVTQFSVDASTGKLTVVKHASTLPEGWNAPKPFDFYDAPSHAAELLINASGDRVYVTNRGHDSIAVMDDELKLLNTTPSCGSIPWTLADAGDDFLVATNQFNHERKDPGSLAVFRKCDGDKLDFVGVKGYITHSKIVCAAVVKFN